MFTRFNGNVVPFADDATSTNRTVFGDITQSDLIDDNLNTNFKKGWEIVGLNDNPTREDFNAMGYTLGALTAYLYEMGISEWNASQNYRTNSRTTGSDGKIYKSLTGTTGIPNVGNNPTTDAVNWQVENITDYSSLTDKTTPIDTDLIPLSDSASSFSLKKLSWINLKTTLKTYFDTLYLTLTGNQTVGGIKTFSSSPIVPTPTTDFQAVTKEYVDSIISSTPTKTGTATFDGTTQNINMTNIGNITLAIGDVIEVSGTTSNNKLFTVESIVDNNNIVVNYEHRGTSTPITEGRLINETASNCTIKLYNRAKNAPLGQGQYWCVPATVRVVNQTYTNNTKREIEIRYLMFANSAQLGVVDGLEFSIQKQTGDNYCESVSLTYKKSLRFDTNAITQALEKR